MCEVGRYIVVAKGTNPFLVHPDSIRKLIDINTHFTRKVFMLISITSICCPVFLPVVFWVKLQGPVSGVFCTWKENKLFHGHIRNTLLYNVLVLNKWLFMH